MPLADLAPHLPLILLLAAIIVIGAFVRRIPIIGTLFSLAIWAALLAALVIVLGQRERFDPYIGRIAEALNIRDQKVVGAETRIRMSPDGHFWANVRFAGVERRMLIDSGATLTALSVDTAAAANLPVQDTLFPVLLRTANGTIRAQTSEVAELRIGNIVARDVPVVVSPAFGRSDILGMNFLSRLASWRVEGRTLILTPHHPQDTTS
ncbi:TIGR02281 family clan AA aspartic protease [Sphingomonas sp. SUN019]|uniref:retropepsin-like aspartic protease family protein n=1 Tax=Sphingomonas sp. SUN019 TaxID=2937788 RepID=UPI002164AF2E|nr:TIGR02281 family clan AA aspartic protease [Sphingomonas sp. SUN019]UVO49003.1 TIGR02281 family clan AA aspartic protease [Sphingomonas sp. SUN019]